MRKLLMLLALLALAPAAYAQQLVNCASSTPCTLSGPSMTGTGDGADVAFGKLNYNWINIWLGATPAVAGGTVIGNISGYSTAPLASSSIVLGAPTGGSCGTGCINAQALEANGYPALSNVNGYPSVTTPFTGAETLPIVQSGTLSKVTLATLIVPTVSVFTTTSGQTSFTLASAALATNATIVVLNGAVLTPTVDYSVSGTSLTLVNGTLSGQTLVAFYW